jgi:mannosyltransferase OCH1-like enzyme
MKIPCIIHQTWKDHDIPESFLQMSGTWKDHHKGWDYLFWTDEMNRDFIKSHFPYFLDIYDSYPFPIQRVDAVRYFILYQYGGVFVDMDFECLSGIDLLIRDSECVFGKEPLDHCEIHQKDFIISNAFMAAAPRFHFLEYILRNLQDEDAQTDHPNDKVLESTGPFMLSRRYTSYARKEEIDILEPEFMYPLTKTELSIVQETGVDEYISGKLKNAYGIHYYTGTWWKKEKL